MSWAAQIMSEIWKTMSADEREAYRSRARDDQKRYKAEQADKVGYRAVHIVVYRRSSFVRV